MVVDMETDDGLKRRAVMVVAKKIWLAHLTSFSGKDEDFYSWRDDAVNAFGKAGLVGFLTDKPLITNHPEMAVSVFYALRAALQGGTASTLSTALYDEKQYDPSLLWKSIEAWYDTAVNRANVVLFEVKRLFYLGNLCLSKKIK